MNRLTKTSTSSDIQKTALRMIMKQHNNFSEQDIIDLVLSQCEDELDEEKVQKIVSKTLEYCRREIHLIDFADGGFSINHDRKDVVGAFLNHEGISI